MKREEIKSIFATATDEQINAIMNLNGADVERVKTRTSTLEADLQKKTADFDALTNEINALKANKATADDYKAKFEQLQADVAKRESDAKAEREAKERAESIANRFNSAVGEKKFAHEAIKDGYLKKFGEALNNKDFTGKSDVEILHDLTKDDNAAFVGVRAFRLEGGTNNGFITNTEPTTLLGALNQKYERK